MHKRQQGVCFVTFEHAMSKLCFFKNKRSEFNFLFQEIQNFHTKSPQTTKLAQIEIVEHEGVQGLCFLWLLDM